MIRGALGLTAILALAARTASAAEEELVLAVEPGYALLDGETDLHGAGGELSLAYGLTDSIWLSFGFGGSRQLARGDVEGRTLAEACGGITAALDVLRVIPFVEVMIGAVGTKLPDRAKIDPTLRLGVGFDVLLTPSVSLGAVLRYRPVSDDLGDSYVTAGLRLAWRIEL